MKAKHAEPPESAQRHWRGLRWILERILPRGIRDEYLELLDENRGSLLQIVVESVAAIAGGYRVQAIASFNKYAFLAETSLVIFCFAAASWPAPLPPSMLIVLGAILCALTVRDAYTHRGAGRKAPPMFHYCLDSAGDAVAAGVFLLAAETLALQVSPSSAFPAPVLYRAAVVCLPLISTLRIVLRPKPDPEAPFGRSSMSARALYKRTWRLNILWMLAFNGLLLQNVSDGPSRLDSLRGFVPGMTFVLWIALQRNALARRDKIETVFGDWKKKMMGRLKETLPQGLQKGEPFYWWYVIVEVVIFLELAAGMLEVLWPWLSGRGGGFVRVGISLAAFATTVLSWGYVKSSNRAAARALQAEIDAPAPAHVQR